jgi:hypothetical protein
MRNKNEFLPIEDAAALLDVSVKFLKRCIIASIVNFKTENGETLLDMTSVDNFIGIKETAGILSISTRTVRRYSKKEKGKRLESYRFGKDLYYQMSDIEDFINQSSSEVEKKMGDEVEA